jgi:hypothetical protein
VASVEQPELAAFEGHHVTDEPCTRALPGGTTGPEVVFEDPLAERLGDHRSAVLHPEQAFDDGQVGGRRRRRDAIDHGRGEAARGVEVGGELRAGAGGQELPAQDRTVGREVVARDEGEWCRRGPAPRLEPVEQPAEGRRSRLVAGLGDGEGDDLDLGPGQELGGARARPVEHLGDGRHHTRLVAFGPSGEHGVKAVLGSELLEGGPRLLGQRGDAPSVAGSLGVGGLVGAVKRSGPEVHDPHRRRRPRLESVPGESGSHRRYSDLGCPYA